MEDRLKYQGIYEMISSFDEFTYNFLVKIKFKMKSYRNFQN